ncbi:hypothetical protein ACFQJ5_06055 [Halomicroarcula sp. GCM10025324]|uniref:hypothetical protein n=1 Tax=Haloarcula TaxID=2237 RepID=UPI0023E7A87C|nr:hypothetical protein [Halomicroarcula sp. ZS-22-S1]
MVALVDIFVAVFVLVFLVPVLAMLAVLWYYFRLGRSLTHVGRRLGVRWWDAAGPVIAGTGLLALVALPGDVPAEGEPGSLPFAVGFGLVVVGTVGAAVAIGNLDEYRQVRRGTDAMAGLDEGPTIVSGTGEVDEDAVTAPLSGEQSLWYSLRVTEDRGIAHRTAPAECHYERTDARFVVDDGSGAVVVDPSGGSVRLWGRPLMGGEDVRVRGGTGSTDAPDLAAVREQAGLDADPDQAFVEHRLEPECAVTVLGTVTRDPETRYPLVSDGERRLVVFEGEAEAVRRRLRRWVRAGAVIGVVGFAVGAAVVLSVGGVV